MGLDTIVCIKYAALRPPEPGGKTAVEHYGLNPFDRQAVEVALTLKDLYEGTVTAVTMGPPMAKKALYECLATGVDRAVLVSDPGLAGSDTLATSKALGAALTRLQPWDMALFGTRSADGDTGHVGPQTMEWLDLPLVTGIVDIEMIENGIKVKRLCDGMLEAYQLPLPGGITVHPVAAELRDVPLHGIEDSFAKSAIETWPLAALALDPAVVGESGSPTRVVSTVKKERARRCRFIEGSPAEQVEQLVAQLQSGGFLDQE